MRKIFILMLILATQIFGANAKRFGIKSGYVQYKLNGYEKGYEKLWFKEHGNYYKKERKGISHFKIGNHIDSSPFHEITITTPKGTWKIDMIKKQGKDLTDFAGLARPAEYMNEEEMEKAGSDMLKQMGGKKLGKVAYLGLEADLVELQGLRSITYKNVPLKISGTTLKQKVLAEATIFKQNIKISDKEFALPKGIKFVDLGKIYNMDKAKLSYSFDKFKTLFKKFKLDGYRKTVVMNTEEGYMASFIGPNGKAISFLLTQYDGQNIKFEKMKKYKTKYMVQTDEGEKISMLVVISPDNRLALNVAGVGVMKKEFLFKQFEKLNIF